MKPAISIIVPVYNVQTYLTKCIDSILDQSFRDFELILVDDGSTDKCGKICDDYAQMDTRVKVIHKENGGLSSARNVGLDVARGDYIGFVDGDDCIHEKMYEILYAILKRYSSDLAIGDYFKVEEGVPINTRGNIIQNAVTHYTNKEALEQLFVYQKSTYVSGAGPSIKWIIACNKLYKRELFENLRFPEGRIFEDEFIAHHILYKCNKVTLCTAKLYYYLQRKNSLLKSPFSVKKWDRVYALKDRMVFLKSVDGNELYEKAIVSFTDAYFWCHFKSKTLLGKKEYDFRPHKKMLIKERHALLRSHYLMRRQKVMICIYIITPFLYNVYLNYKGLGKVNV